MFLIDNNIVLEIKHEWQLFKEMFITLQHVVKL